MAVEVFALCKGAGATVFRAFVWEDVLRGVTPDRLLLAGVDFCQFAGFWGRGSKELKLKLKVESKYLGIKNILEFA